MARLKVKILQIVRAVIFPSLLELHLQNQYLLNSTSFIARLVLKLNRRRMLKIYSSQIHPSADIHNSVIFPHPIGIVIGKSVCIGKGSIIYQNVTLGSQRKDMDLYPFIADDVTIYANSVIVGKVIIDNNTIVPAMTFIKANT